MKKILLLLLVTVFSLTGIIQAEESKDLSLREKLAKLKKTLPAAAQPDAGKAIKLANSSYKGPFRLVGEKDQCLGYGYKPKPLPSAGQMDETVWLAIQGTYGPKPLIGYWIFYPDVYHCWQAEHFNGPFNDWNKDDSHDNEPQDWEMFAFILVDAGKATVKVKNALGGYVRLTGGKYACDASEADAAVFTVE